MENEVLVVLVIFIVLLLIILYQRSVIKKLRANITNKSSIIEKQKIRMNEGYSRLIELEAEYLWSKFDWYPDQVLTRVLKEYLLFDLKRSNVNKLSNEDLSFFAEKCFNDFVFHLKKQGVSDGEIIRLSPTHFKVKYYDRFAKYAIKQLSTYQGNRLNPNNRTT